LSSKFVNIGQKWLQWFCHAKWMYKTMILRRALESKFRKTHLYGMIPSKKLR
jgi:uncharacterized ferritin-like protein (DUF455 family)